MSKCFDYCFACIGGIVCCPCIACYSTLNYCYQDTICLNTVCQNVFEDSLLTDFELDKKWNIGKKNWLSISKENRNKLAKKLFKILYKQFSEFGIDIQYILKDHYGKLFFEKQLRWFIKMFIIHHYETIDNKSWNPNSDSFELVPLEKETLGWKNPEFPKQQGQIFIDRFLYIDSVKVKYDKNTEKDDEIETLQLKYYRLINSLLDREIDYVSILSKSNSFLKKVEEDCANNKRLAQERLS